MTTVSLIIPIYNEAKHLEVFLKSIDALTLCMEKELVIVDDGSKDESWSILESYPFASKVRLIAQGRNLGKGAAIHRGIREASGDVIGVQDADFEYDPHDINRLLEPLLDGRADVVYGSRFREGHQVHRTYHYLVNRGLTLLSNLCSGLYLTDMETCYKFFRADILKNILLESKRFGFEPEITAKIARLKLKVMELPISYFPRNYIEGKKITWRDGVAALRHILYYNFAQENDDCFSDDMPKEYIIEGREWL